MSQFMRAHGYLPGPDQRPVRVGLIAGLLASLPPLVLLLESSAAAHVSRQLNVQPLVTLLLWVMLGAAGGGLYGRVFMRAANDRRGGWLFGISFGFLVWTLGPVTIAQWLAGKTLVTGGAAMALFAAYLCYGLILGLLFPWVHQIVDRRKLLATR
jgi:hypothetical protein